jgi:hypothetical protein
MEILIVICLVIIIILLLHDKIVIKKVSENEDQRKQNVPSLPEIMGQPKSKERLVLPSYTDKSQTEKQVKEDNTFDTETEEKDLGLEIPQEELDEVFGQMPDLEEEEEEWQMHGAPNGEGGFATGVTFEELSTVGSLLQQEMPETALQQRAVDIVHRIQGTELFSLLENAMGSTAERIARLLDNSIHPGADSGSSTMRNKGLGDFDIGEFV